MRRFLKHLLFPHQGNNYRAKLLHNDSLLVIISVLFFATFCLSFLRTTFPSVLGITSQVSIQELIALTNQKRMENNLPPLVLNDQLSLAANSKAMDMFANNYWSHNSPDGKTPWFFIRSAGYNYLHAGENLARGFNNANDAVNAWMASPEHRKNILSSNYDSVGFAIQTGVLNGEETILIVEMFGSTPKQQVVAQVSNVSEEKEIEKENLLAVSAQTPEKEIDQQVKSEQQEVQVIKPFFDSVSLSKNLIFIILSIFLLALIIELIMVRKKNVVRFVGHNLDHILFIITVLILITILTRGAIL